MLELGVLIDSPLIARQFLDEFDQGLAELSDKVGLDDEGRLQWLAPSFSPGERKNRPTFVDTARRFNFGTVKKLPPGAANAVPPGFVSTSSPKRDRLRYLLGFVRAASLQFHD